MQGVFYMQKFEREGNIMKYIIHYGYGNTLESNSRNVKKWIRDLGVDRVTITTKSGKFVCEGNKQHNDTIIITTTEA